MHTKHIIFSILAAGFTYFSFSQETQGATFLEIDVLETQCYRHIIDSNDIGCITRYVHKEDAVLPIHSVSGNFLSIANSTSTLASIFVPVNDNGLAVHYFEPTDPNIPSWDDSSVETFFRQNPFIFTSPTETTRVAVEWNNTATSGGNFAETKAELQADIPLILLRMEESTSDFDSGNLVIGSFVSEQEQILTLVLLLLLLMF